MKYSDGTFSDNAHSCVIELSSLEVASQKNPSVIKAVSNTDVYCLPKSNHSISPYTTIHIAANIDM